MLTKVGRKRPMLICSDCGHPLSEADASERVGLRLSGSLIRLALAAISGMTFFLTQMRAGPGAGSEPAEKPQPE